MATNTTTQGSDTATKTSSTSRTKKAAGGNRRGASKRRSTARSRKASRSSNGNTGRSNGLSANTLLRQGREALSGAYDQAWSTGKSIRRMGSNLHLGASRRSVTSILEDNPLVLGAVGLGIGMVLGAMMPSVDMRSVRGVGRSIGMDMASGSKRGGKRGRGRGRKS